MPTMLIDRASPIRVFVVAAPLLAWGIEQIVRTGSPRFEVSGVAPEMSQALDAMVRQQADVAVVLLDGIDSSGVVQFCSQCPARVLLVADVAEGTRLDEAVKHGARGVLSTREPAATLLKAIDKVHDGELWIDRDAVGRIFMHMARRKAQERDDPENSKIATLTLRERQTVAAVAQHVGLPGKLIADRMCISEHTLRNHLRSIYSKLGVSSRLDLYAYATAHHLCAPD